MLAVINGKTSIMTSFSELSEKRVLKINSFRELLQPQSIESNTKSDHLRSDYHSFLLIIIKFYIYFTMEIILNLGNGHVLLPFFCYVRYHFLMFSRISSLFSKTDTCFNHMTV